MESKKQHTVLSIKNLSVGYHTKKIKNPIIQDISIDLKKGHLIGLIGINGSGKSTLIRTLAGLQPPLSGTIELNNTPLSSIKLQELATQISVVLTKQTISKNLTVSELVSLGRQPYTNWLGTLSTLDHQKINDALQLTEITVLKDKRCFELSDGQLQRVLIARALAQDTAIIILDEPMSHLDLHHKAALFKLLASISCEQDKTILYATHDIEFALEVSDHLIVLQHKKAIYHTPEELIRNGTFDDLFPNEHILFNKQKRAFFLR